VRPCTLPTYIHANAQYSEHPTHVPHPLHTYPMGPMPHTPYMMHLHFTNPTNTVTSCLVYTLPMHPYSIL